MGLSAGERPRADVEVLASSLAAVEYELARRMIDASAEKLRGAASTGSIPTRGSLPGALSVTLEQTGAGDPLWTTSRGHSLTDAEARFRRLRPHPDPHRGSRGPAAGASRRRR